MGFIPPIRGSEQNITIAIDGITQGVDFKTTNFHLKPRVANNEIEYSGDDVPKGDQMFSGYDVSFDCLAPTPVGLAFMLNLQSRQKDHLAPPKVQITIHEVYRDGGSRSDVLLTPVTLRPVDRGHGNRKDYVGQSWEGYAEDASLIS